MLLLLIYWFFITRVFAQAWPLSWNGRLVLLGLSPHRLSSDVSYWLNNRLLHPLFSVRGPLTFDGWYPRDHKPGQYPENEVSLLRWLVVAYLETVLSYFQFIFSCHSRYLCYIVFRKSVAVRLSSMVFVLRIISQWIKTILSGMSFKLVFCFLSRHNMNREEYWYLRYAGDYPDLGVVTYDHKDPYESWTDRNHRRNWGEMVSVLLLLICHLNWYLFYLWMHSDWFCRVILLLFFRKVRFRLRVKYLVLTSRWKPNSVVRHIPFFWWLWYYRTSGNLFRYFHSWKNKSHTSITDKLIIFLRWEWTWWTTVEIVSLSLDSRLKITPRIFFFRLYAILYILYAVYFVFVVNGINCSWASIKMCLRVLVPMALLAYYFSREDPNAFRWKNPAVYFFL